MSRSVAVVLTVTLFTLVTGSAALARIARAREAGAPIGRLAPSPAELERVSPHLSVPLSEPIDLPLDLYGNEVSSAVAGYTYDRSGGLLYEEHSPRTEVPRLTPPIS